MPEFSNEWFSFAEILTVAQRDLPNSERSLQRHIRDNGWKLNAETFNRKATRTGNDQFHISLLPASVQLRLKATVKAVQNSFEDAVPETSTREILWQRYERLTTAQKETCQRRLDFLTRIEELINSGSKKKHAIATASVEFDFSISTYRNWMLLVKTFDRADWLAALAPQYKSAMPKNKCHPKVWGIIKTDYLRPEKPSLTSVYRRAVKIAEKEGYEPLPMLRTIRRWIEREVPREVQIMARENRDVSKNLYPAQRRTRSHLHAMQHVNIDGHKFDVFVNFGTKEDPRVVRPMMIAIQDLYSNMFVAHRISDSENKEVIRLCIGDMVENHGIPEELTTDNGRAFASKQITGGAKTRFRYKIKDEEPTGLLVSMGVKIKWTLPYSGQSKPIERAFRDICDTIARHPFCAGAYTGNNIENAPDNRGSKAIMLDDFIPFVKAEMDAHNARTDRNTENSKGRSFLETFNASMALDTTMVKTPTVEQRRLWLLAAEQIKAKRGSGEIELYGARYWTPQLNAYASQKLMVRFDPQDLKKDIHIYSNAGAYLFDAELLSDARFDDVDAARDHSRKRRTRLKAIKTQADIEREFTLDELARLQPAPEPMPKPKPKKVRRMATGGVALKTSLAVRPEEDFEPTGKVDFESSFANAVNNMPEVNSLGENILPFKNNE